MMLIAMQVDRRHRTALARCTWGFLLLGTGMVYSGFAARDERWPILALAVAVVVGTLAIYRGLDAFIGTQAVARRRVAAEVVVLVAVLLLAWGYGPRVFAITFHVLCLAVAVGITWIVRRALVSPRNAAEPAVAVTLLLYAVSWVVALVALLRHDGPESRHLVYVGAPLDAAYAVLYALLPLIVGALVLNLTNARLSERLRRQANTDELTGLLARRALLDRHARWRDGLRARGQAAAVLLIDVDHFKSINDTRGHEAGDEVLRALGQRMRGQLRRECLLARWGGEEFLALVDAPDLVEARAVAERLRNAVGQRPFAFRGAGFSVSVSIGMAPWPADMPFALAIGRADAALYAAKHGGRDRVVADGDADVSAPAEASPGTP